MRNQPENEITRFVSLARKRLWMATVAACGFRNAWWTAWLLLALGLVHVFWITVPVWLLFALIMIPVILTVSTGIARQPDMIMAASSADRWFEGRALLSSAIDIISSHPQHDRRPAQSLVLHQARQAVRRWLPELHARSAIQLPPRVPLLLIMLAIGCLLILQPGPQQIKLDVDITTGPDRPAASPSARSDQFISQIRRAQQQDVKTGNRIVKRAVNDNIPADAVLHNSDDSPDPSAFTRRHDVLQETRNQQSLLNPAELAGTEKEQTTVGNNSNGRLPGLSAAGPDTKATHLPDRIPVRAEEHIDININTHDHSGGVAIPLSASASEAGEHQSGPGIAFSASSQYRYFAALPPAVNRYVANYFRSLEDHANGQ